MRLVKISFPKNIKYMENFNVQFSKHSRLELLKHFFEEHGTLKQVVHTAFNGV